MTEIYAVSSGEYSDYRVNAIFVRREDAEAAIAAGFPSSYHGGEVEEFDLYEPGQMPKKIVHVRYYGWVRIATGDVQRDDHYTEDQWFHPSADPSTWQTGVNIHPWPHVNPDRMELTVSGVHNDRTHKVYTDALAKLRSECVDGLHGGA